MVRNTRRAAGVDAPDLIPDRQPRGGVQPGRRLVEEQHLGRVHQRTGEVEAALHPARIRLGPAFGRVVQPDELQQLGRRGDPALTGDPVETALQLEQLPPASGPDRDRSPAAPRRCAGAPRRRRPTTSSPATEALPAVGGSSVHSIRTVVVLPAPLGPRKPNTSPCETVRSMSRTASIPPLNVRRSDRAAMAASSGSGVSVALESSFGGFDYGSATGWNGWLVAGPRDETARRRRNSSGRPRFDADFCEGPAGPGTLVTVRRLPESPILACSYPPRARGAFPSLGWAALGVLAFSFTFPATALGRARVRRAARRRRPLGDRRRDCRRLSATAARATPAA